MCNAFSDLTQRGLPQSRGRIALWAQLAAPGMPRARNANAGDPTPQFETAPGAQRTFERISGRAFCR